MWKNVYIYFNDFSKIIFNVLNYLIDEEITIKQFESFLNNGLKYELNNSLWILTKDKTKIDKYTQQTIKQLLQLEKEIKELINDLEHNKTNLESGFNQLKNINECLITQIYNTITRQLKN